MAEFCLNCLNKMDNTQATERDYILSNELDLCEGCGQWKRVVVRERDLKLLYDLTQIARFFLSRRDKH